MRSTVNPPTFVLILYGRQELTIWTVTYFTVEEIPTLPRQSCLWLWRRLSKIPDRKSSTRIRGRRGQRASEMWQMPDSQILLEKLPKSGLEGTQEILSSHYEASFGYKSYGRRWHRREMPKNR